jgi:hypothetical protein
MTKGRKKENFSVGPYFLSHVTPAKAVSMADMGPSLRRDGMKKCDLTT